MTDALGFEFDTVICHDFEEAKRKLDNSISLILCGLRFNEGMIFDLLRHAKASPNTKPIPFYTVVEAKNIFPPSILSSIDSAAKVLGSNGTINLFDIKTKSGESNAYEHLRQLIRETV